MQADEQIPENIPTFSNEQFKRFYEGWCLGQTVSTRTRQRWRKLAGVKSNYPHTHGDFLRQASIASAYLEIEAERCFQARAHLGVGALLTSRIELLIQFHLVTRSREVRKLALYKKLALNPGFLSVITTLRLEHLFALARKIGLFSKARLIDRSLEVLAYYGYPKDINGALKYLRDCRNGLHPAALANNVPLILRELPAEPLEAFDDFHFEFAAIAIQIMGMINECSPGPDIDILHCM
jgi:hypothetical protein